MHNIAVKLILRVIRHYKIPLLPSLLNRFIPPGSQMTDKWNGRVLKSHKINDLVRFIIFGNKNQWIY